MDDTADVDDANDSIVEATQHVRATPEVRKSFEAGRRMNRAYCVEMPGLTVSSKLWRGHPQNSGSRK